MARTGGSSLRHCFQFAHASFQGFRIATVENNVITKMRYVTLKELRQRDLNVAV